MKRTLETTLEKTINPDGSTTVYTYDENGNRITVKDRSGIITETEYNESDMPVSVNNLSDTKKYSHLKQTLKYCHAGPAFESTYEDASTDPPTTEVLKTSYEYNRFGEPVKRRQEALADSTEMSVAYAYDDAGNLASYTVISGAAGSPNWTKTVEVEPMYITGANDEENYLEQALLVSSAPIITEKINFLGLLESTTFASTTERVLTRTYDNFLRLKRIVSNEGGTKSFDLNLERDFAGNITRRYEPQDTPTTDLAYTYDGMHRLASAEGESYTYDELSNIVTRGTEKTYTYEQSGVGQQMRIASFEDGATEYTYEYDGTTQQTGEGNTTKIDAKLDSLVYDDVNRLREVTHPDDQEDRYWYNHAGLRVKKVEDVNRDNGNTEITYTMYAGQEILFQDVYEDNGTTTTLIETRFNLLSLAGRPQILAQYRKVYAGSEELRFFANDHLGSCRVAYTSAGAAGDSFSYSAYGEKTHSTQTSEFLSHFTGKQYDASGLIYFNARYYDPETGRFLREDPGRDGLNWYQYAAGNPVRMVDPDGKMRTLEPGEMSSPAPHPQSTDASTTFGTPEFAYPPGPWDFGPNERGEFADSGIRIDLNVDENTGAASLGGWSFTRTRRALPDGMEGLSDEWSTATLDFEVTKVTGTVIRQSPSGAVYRQAIRTQLGGSPVGVDLGEASGTGGVVLQFGSSFIVSGVLANPDSITAVEAAVTVLVDGTQYHMSLGVNLR